MSPATAHHIPTFSSCAQKTLASVGTAVVCTWLFTACMPRDLASAQKQHKVGACKCTWIKQGTVRSKRSQAILSQDESRTIVVVAAPGRLALVEVAQHALLRDRPPAHAPPAGAALRRRLVTSMVPTSTS